MPASADLDEPKALLAAEAMAYSEEVDLVYSHSYEDSTDRLSSPHWAKDHVSFAAHWSTYNTTRFFKLPPGISFETVETKAHFLTLWDPSLATTSSLDVVENDVIFAKTGKDRVFLMEISKHQPGPQGYIEIRILKQEQE